MPMALMVWMVSSDRPPKVSATKGMHSAPIARQADRLEASFRRVPTSSAWPRMVDASARVNFCSREMTWTSTGRPWCQLGSRMLAGLARELGTKPAILGLRKFLVCAEQIYY